MSTTIDQRVVEMQFDNSQFERNVSTSMSTLDKLKKSLNLTGAAKGLEDVGTATKNVNMTGLGNAVDTVRTKFSALEIMGVTALANITNSAVNAGKRIVSALTIDPIKSGFNEYETQLNAVQTILANTESKGSTLQDVNDALDELNKYADLTIYNFTEMTRNIGTFTAAGVDLETSVNAIKGIANLAAVSGSTSQQASTAMYQLSQALASGTVKLMDWNSVVNAGMGGQVFQDALKETARVHGIAIDKMVKDEGSFRETLSKGWLTSEILTETLRKFTLATENMTEAEIEKNRQMLKSKGYTDEQIESIFKLGNTATNAATKVKTFTQMWDVLKEAAQSGWSQTWRLIFGDFEQAKELFTPLTNFFTNIIQKISDFRNTLLQDALSSPFEGLLKKLDVSGLGVIGKIAEETKSMTDSLKYYQDVVTDVWRGDYKNAPDRYDLLTEAGYDPKVVQSLVNKGYEYKLTIEDVNEAIEKYGTTAKKASESTDDVASSMADLTDEQLKSIGYTDEEITVLRELAKEAEKNGITLEEQVKKMEQVDGRTLLIESFKNAGQGLVTVITAIKEAWVDVFPPMTSLQLYNIIAGIHKFSEKLIVGEEAAGKLKRTFKGVFALLDIATTLITGPFKLAFKIITNLLGAMDLNILDVTASIGDSIVAFRDWLFGNNEFIQGIGKSILAIGNWIKAFVAMPEVQSKIQAVKDALSAFWKTVTEKFQNGASFVQEIARGLMDGSITVKDALTLIGDKLKESLSDFFSKAVEIGKNIIEGLKEGLSGNDFSIIDILKQLGEKLISSIKEVLGIHSPSTEFIEIGKNIMMGLISGISSIGLLKIVSKIIGILDKLASPIEGVGDVLSGVGQVLARSAKGVGRILKSTAKVVKSFSKVVKSFAGVMKSVSFSIKAKALVSIATAILMLVGAIVVLTLIDPDKLSTAITALLKIAGILAGLAVVVAVLSVAAGKLGGGDTKSIAAFALVILSIGASLLILVAAMKMLGNMSVGQFVRAIIGIIVAVAAIEKLLIDISIIGESANKAGTAIFKIAAAMLILALVAKIIASMTWPEMGKAGAGLLGLTGIIALLTLITKIQKNDVSDLGSVLVKIAGAMLILTFVVELLASMEWSEMLKAGAGLLGLTGIIALLVLITKINNGNQIGNTLLAIAGAVAILAVVAKLLGTMSLESMGKAAVGMLGLVGIMALLTLITKMMSEKDLIKVGVTLLLMSLSIGILAGIAALLGLMNLENLAKGVVAVGILAAMMALMTAATRGAQECKGNLIVLTVAIAVMAAAVYALSTIEKDKLIYATGAISLVIGMFALLVKASGTAKGSIGTLIVMTVAVGLIAVILYYLSSLPIESTISAAVSLSILLLAMSVSVAILSKFAGNIGGALAGVIALTAMAFSLWVVANALSAMDNLINAKENAIILGLLIAEFTLLLIPLTLIGSFALAALAGVLALTGMAIPLMVFIGILSKMDNIENAMTKSMLIITLMNSLTNMLIKIAIVGPLALIGVTALTALTTLIGAVGAFAVAVGALMEKFPSLEKFLDKGLPVLEKIATSLGTMLGNFITGFVSSVLDGFKEFGDAIVAFATALDGAPLDALTKSVGPIGSLVDISNSLEKTGGLFDFITGKTDYDAFSNGLFKIAWAIRRYCFALEDAPLDALTNSVGPVGSLVEIMNSLEKTGGWIDLLTGTIDYDAFSDGLFKIAWAIRRYCFALEDAPLDALTNSTEPVKSLIDTVSGLEKTGGWIDLLTGTIDYDAFSDGLFKFAWAIRRYCFALEDAPLDVISNSVGPVESLIDTVSGLEKTGGWIDLLTGTIDYDAFSDGLFKFAWAIRRYCFALEDAPLDALTNSIEPVKSLIEIVKMLPEESLWNKVFGGEINFENISDGIFNFAWATRRYAYVLEGVPLAVISDSIGAIQSLIEIIDLIPKEKRWYERDTDFDSIKTMLSTLGGALNDYNSSISAVDIDRLARSTNQFVRIVNAFGDISDIDFANAKSFSETLGSIGEAGIDSFIKAFEDAETRISTAGEDMISAFTDGVEKKSETIVVVFTNVIAKCITAIKDKRADFYNAGLYVVEGFVSGIKNNSYKVKLEAETMASAAIKGAKNKLLEKSPSRAFYEIGAFAGQGFANALRDYSSNAYKAGSVMAANAKNGLQEAIGRVSSIFSSDMDVQPVIRPVLDLSDVETGAGTINSLLGMTPSANVLSNVGGVSLMMNSRQNGVNSDIISAIDKLRKDINDMDRNSYTVNGLTYDDGSNVSEAVKALIRATRVERRV